MPEILLRFVEGASVALYRHEPRGQAELVPTRGDLYDYSGGFGWGRPGPAQRSLSCAIVGKLYGLSGYHRKELARRARILEEQVLAKLDAKTAYDMPLDALKAIFEKKPPAA
ncbi:MAG TPA: hypothetical protein VJ806_06285 [Luteimonas sp.]|nr:hypothetical protein [Luteimonas sp.]